MIGNRMVVVIIIANNEICNYEKFAFHENI